MLITPITALAYFITGYGDGWSGGNPSNPIEPILKFLLLPQWLLNLIIPPEQSGGIGLLLTPFWLWALARLLARLFTRSE